MRRYGRTMTSRQWREIRLVRSLLRDWGADLSLMTPKCVIRRVESGFAHRKANSGGR
jgi:hypothetical protein